MSGVPTKDGSDLKRYDELWWHLVDVDNFIDEENLGEVRKKIAPLLNANRNNIEDKLKYVANDILIYLDNPVDPNPPWKIFLDLLSQNGPNLRKAPSFLLGVKYVRAVLLSAPEKPKISDRLDELANHLLMNLHLTENDLVLRLFFILESAFCSAGEVSRGFVSMARTTYFELANDPKQKDVIKKLWSVKSLLHFNEGLALTHMGHRKDAGRSFALAIKSFWEGLDETEINGGSLKDGEKLKISNFILIPTFLARAVLLSNMQFSVNSIHTIRRLREDFKKLSNNTIKLDDMIYRNTRATLVEALAWLDIGEIKAGKEKLSNCLEEGQEWLKTNTTPNKEEIKKYLQGDEKNRRSLTVSCYLQYKIENLKYFILEDLAKNELKDKADECLGELEKICDILYVFLEVYQEDRFTRQNLKELYIDLLEIVKGDLFRLVKSKDVKMGGGNDDSKKVVIETVRNNNIIKLNEIVKTILVGLNMGPDCEESSVWLKEGTLANELWTGDYKNIAPDTRQRLGNILNDLLDEYSDFYKEEKEGGVDFKDVFCKAIENELLILGVGEKNGNLVFAPDLANDLDPNENDGLKRFKEKFPKKNTYEYRKNLRRAIYVQDLKKRVENNGDLDFQYTWLKEEFPKSGGIYEECLINLAESWRVEAQSPTKILASKASHIGSTTIPLKEYPKIIGESEIVKMFGHKKSNHPVNRQKERSGETKKDGSAGFQFVCLRRWNSFTPEMSYSVGGGYFLFYPDESSDEVEKDHYRKTKIGIVVDPGFDFLHNFFRQGFTLDDIDIILITHGHSDHINDFRTIADLLMERENRPAMGRKGRSKRIFTLMSLNAYPLVKHHIQGEAFRRLYSDTIIVDIDREYNPDSIKKGIKFGIKEGAEGGLKYLSEVQYEAGDTEGGLELRITPVPVSHNDYADSDPYCFGYVIKLRDVKDKSKPKEIATIGFTGDSQWFPELANEFKECQFVCSHMGSLLGDKQENYLEDKLNVGCWEELIRKKNHLYLPGQILFLQQLRAMEVQGGRVVALSEFGEEMKGGLRKDVCERINLALDKGCWDAFGDGNELPDNKCKPRCNKTDGVRVIPADVGLRISVHKDSPTQVHCALCDGFCPIEDVEAESFGYEEALFYVCRACSRSKSQDVRWRKYATLLEVGRPVRE